MDSPWALLEIEPTRDASLIRRAYARQVKAGPDADRFHRLRGAREAALREAASPDRSTRLDEKLDEKLDEPSARGDARRASSDDVRDGSRVIDEDHAPAEAPKGVVRMMAPLFDTERSWATARRLRPTILASLAAGDEPRLASAVQQAAMLPRGPRRDLEATCIKALVEAWRTPDGDLDAAQVARTTPLLAAADRAFGWGGDDSVLTEVLPPCDADAVNVVLDEAEYRSRSRRLPAAMRMRRADAFAFFTRSEVRRGLYEKTIQRGRMPWRINLATCAAPHLWAFHHRLWRELVLLHLLLGLPSSILWLVEERSAPSWWVLVGLSALFLAILASAGLLADRMLFAAAERAVRSADRKGLYDKARRETFLSERNRPPSPIYFFIYLVYLFFPVFFPYWILLETLARLTR